MRMDKLIAITCAAAACALVLCGAGLAPAQDKLDLDSMLAGKEKVETAADTAVEEAGAGDNRLFKVVTDDDITSLEAGDIYKNEKSVFKVTAIKSKGAAGGRFVVQRIGGKANPTRKWSRVSGLGPPLVVSRETFWDLYLAGGFLMHPIALCLFATIVICFNNLWVYRYSRFCPPGFTAEANACLQRGELARLGELSSKNGSLIGRVCRAMIAEAGGTSEQDIRGRAETEWKRQMAIARIPLRALGFIAAVAPLLGLLGTVIGMVQCFESLAFESASASKAQLLSAGIRVALFTTVGGLATAVPAMFINFLFGIRLGGIAADCEQVAEQWIGRVAEIRKTEVKQTQRGGDLTPDARAERAIADSP